MLVQLDPRQIKKIWKYLIALLDVSIAANQNLNIHVINGARKEILCLF